MWRGMSTRTNGNSAQATSSNLRIAASVANASASGLRGAEIVETPSSCCQHHAASKRASRRSGAADKAARSSFGTASRNELTMPSDTFRSTRHTLPGPTFSQMANALSIARVETPAPPTAPRNAQHTADAGPSPPLSAASAAARMRSTDSRISSAPALTGRMSDASIFIKALTM